MNLLLLVLLAAPPSDVVYDCGVATPRHEPTLADSVLAALDAELPVALDADTLPIEDRITIQNIALEYAVHRRDHDPKRAEAAARLVTALALPAQELEKLGTEPSPELDRWIGPRSQWREKTVRLFLHDMTFEFTRSFRAVGSGSLRVLFSQRIAVDTAGRIHLTPVLGEIEVRRGTDPTSPACVLEVHGAKVSPVAFEQLPRTNFIHAVGSGRIGCNSCHASTCENFNLDVAADAVAARHAQWKRFLGYAQQRVGQVL